MTAPAPASSRVLVQVVTHQSASWVPSLAGQLRAFPRVVVADNASADGTAEALRTVLPQARVLALPENLGFGAAHLLAAKAGLMAWPDTDFLLLLNPDCALAPGALEVLVARLEAQPSLGAVSPALFHDDGAPQATHGPAFFHGASRAHGSVGGPAEWLSGACLLVRREAWDAVGGFDPRYFLFYEDDDLCLRLQRAGWGCWYEPAARATHARGTGSQPSWRGLARKAFHLARSKRLALQTWVGRAAAWRFRLKTAAGAVVAVPLFLLLLQPRQALKWAARGLSACVSVERPWRALPP